MAKAKAGKSKKNAARKSAPKSNPTPKAPEHGAANVEIQS